MCLLILVQLKVMLQKNIKPKDSTLAVLSVSCSRGLELDLAETLLDQISKCNHVNVFNELLEACDKLVSVPILHLYQ